MKDTIQQLPQLSPAQLLHATEYYRAEVDEKILSKAVVKVIKDMRRGSQVRSSITSERLSTSSVGNGPRTQGSAHDPNSAEAPATSTASKGLVSPEHLLLDPALMLPFHLPTSTDLRVSYGAGFGGVNRERARKYVPTIPPEIFAKVDVGNKYTTSIYSHRSWNDD